MNQSNINGYFNYWVHPNKDLRPAYNMLRHAGCIYSLLMYNEFSNDHKSGETATSAVNFLKQVSIGPINELENMLGIWSYPGIIPNIKKPQLKLGGSGLGLVALTSLERFKHRHTPITYMQHVANFICFMQKENGSFYSKYFPKPIGRDDRWTSLYYPGEAVLGLCLLYEIDNNEKWLKTSLKAINYLYELRKNKTIVEADHWALIATGRLLNIIRTIDTNYIHYESVLIKHAIKVCERIISTAAHFPESTPYYGCLNGEGRTTPSATRLEGLITAYTYIPKEHITLRKQMFNIINKGILFLTNAQIKEGKFIGGMPRTYIANHSIPKSINIKNKRNAEIRIDYVQHALSAMILYEKVFY